MVYRQSTNISDSQPAKITPVDLATLLEEEVVPLLSSWLVLAQHKIHQMSKTSNGYVHFILFSPNSHMGIHAETQVYTFPICQLTQGIWHTAICCKIYAFSELGLGFRILCHIISV